MLKDVIDIVKDFSQWKGNTFTLANLVAAYVKEECAKMAENLPEGATSIEAANAIREAS